MAFPLELCNLVTKTITEVIWWMRSLVREQNKSDLNPQTIMRRMRIYAQGSRILKPDTSGNEGIEPKLVDKHLFSCSHSSCIETVSGSFFPLTDVWLFCGNCSICWISESLLSFSRHTPRAWWCTLYLPQRAPTTFKDQQKWVYVSSR